MDDAWQQEERLFLHYGNEWNTGTSGRRYFSRGGVKYALLELLEQENMHGYQMMKALEEQSGGVYKPSAGSIYPTLQMLRDQELVVSFKQDGKKVFQITEEGRVFLQEEKERLESSDAGDPVRESRESFLPEDGGEPWDGARKRRRFTPAGKELLHLLRAAERAALADPSKAARLRISMAHLRDSLRQIAADDMQKAPHSPEAGEK